MPSGRGCGSDPATADQLEPRPRPAAHTPLPARATVWVRPGNRRPLETQAAPGRAPPRTHLSLPGRRVPTSGRGCGSDPATTDHLEPRPRPHVPRGTQIGTRAHTPTPRRPCPYTGKFTGNGAGLSHAVVNSIRRHESALRPNACMISGTPTPASSFQVSSWTGSRDRVTPAVPHSINLDI